ncbi:MAG TPA: molybdenum cofactor guanylyltransferase [Candidatus Thalassarchaeaceae archaeon]|nr:molybdenum cofactor guanylyltransferase [Candidatus Thalassarchaeaceae archaeon]
MYPALILAGGASKRMGKNKATMIVDGSPMIARVAHALRDAGCKSILVAVRDGFQRSEIMGALSHLTDVQCILDNDLERSAKSGLRSALRECAELGIERIQLAPCDMPWIRPQIFERLQEGSRPVMMPKGEHLQPLLSLVHVDVVLAALERAEMRASLKNTLRSVPCQIVEISDKACFRNVNSLKDMDS